VATFTTGIIFVISTQSEPMQAALSHGELRFTTLRRYRSAIFFLWL